MRHLLLLLAMIAAGQMQPRPKDPSGWPLKPIRCIEWKDRWCVARQYERIPLPVSHQYRIEWLEPAETYNERVIFELSLRILVLETRLELLQMAAGGELRKAVPK